VAHGSQVNENSNGLRESVEQEPVAAWAKEKPNSPVFKVEAYEVVQAVRVEVRGDRVTVVAVRKKRL